MAVFNGPFIHLTFKRQRETKQRKKIESNFDGFYSTIFQMFLYQDDAVSIGVTNFVARISI